MPDTSLAIGPSNYAGQATAWARAVSLHLSVHAWSFAGRPLRGGGYGFEVDRLIGRLAFRSSLARGPRSRALLGATSHVALDGFKSFFRWDRHASFPRDARRLRDQGYTMALIAHGSDVRDPRTHQERDPFSYFSVGSEQWRNALTEQTARNREFSMEVGWPVYYSTPDLGFDLPWGEWLPVVVDVDSWASEEPLLEREKPLVVHVPSQRNPPIKGSHLIVPVLQQLDEEGVIEFVCPRAMPHSQVRELVRSCDVLVDQIMFGSYGVAAVEAMAAGRVTVGRMTQAVRETMLEAPQMLEATPETLRDVIISVLERREELRATAQHNLRFVKRWHDGTQSARVLSSFIAS